MAGLVFTKLCTSSTYINIGKLFFLIGGTKIVACYVLPIFFCFWNYSQWKGIIGPPPTTCKIIMALINWIPFDQCLIMLDLMACITTKETTRNIGVMFFSCYKEERKLVMRFFYGQKVQAVKYLIFTLVVL